MRHFCQSALSRWNSLEKLCFVYKKKSIFIAILLYKGKNVKACIMSWELAGRFTSSISINRQKVTAWLEIFFFSFIFNVETFFIVTLWALSTFLNGACEVCNESSLNSLICLIVEISYLKSDVENNLEQTIQVSRTFKTHTTTEPDTVRESPLIHQLLQIFH